MDEVKYLTNRNSYVLIASIMQKICKSIKQQQGQKIPDNTIKEIDFLREQCTSDNTQLSLMACHTFVRLVLDGNLELSPILTMFTSMLSSSKSSTYTAISESVISLLLLDLKRQKILQKKDSDQYQCPFGLKQPQHPLITLLINRKDPYLSDFANKINGICNHHDREIRVNSIEFLRPVFIYILCNPAKISDSKRIWTYLLAQCKSSKIAEDLVYEILLWNRITTPASFLFANGLLTETIEFMLNKPNLIAANELIIFQTILLNDLIEYGYDPRPGSAILMKYILKNGPSISNGFYNLILISLAKTLHIVSPIYLPDIIRVIKTILMQNNGGNIITRNMILDGLVLWIGNPTFFTLDISIDIHLLIKFISTEKPSKIASNSTLNLPVERKYFHPDIAFCYNLAQLSEQFDVELRENSKFPKIHSFLQGIQEKRHLQFCSKINLFLRGLLMCPEIDEEHWLNILHILMKCVPINAYVAVDLIWPLLYKLSNTSKPQSQLEILTNLVQFGIVKENIPIILNVIKAISDGALRTLSIDLYFKLWKCENRTYPFLHKALCDIDGKDSFETQITKACTLKEICLLKPAQHGGDLVNLLSNILNTCSGSKGDAATAIALDAILILCRSHTVNIVSTWSVLADKFGSEKRTRSLKSLCNFFGHVPLLRSPTMAYEKLYVDVRQKLWRYTVASEKPEIITAALNALQNYNYNEMSLKEIPETFRQYIKLTSEFKKTPIDAARNPVDVLPYIPGECWIELIENCHPDATEAAVNLVGHYINEDIKSYRSGVYHLHENKPEPNNLNQLNARSPLKAIVAYLTEKSKLTKNMNDTTLENCLRCISRKFIKPIPPLNWFFLLEYLYRSYEMKKYCLKIAANQVFHSGSAKILIENYFRDFDATASNPIELRDLLAFVPMVGNGISSSIFIPFLQKIFNYTYTVSEKDGFKNDCLFREALKCLRTVSSRNIQTCVNLAGCSDIALKYFDLIDLDSPIFPDFASACCNLTTSDVESMTSPNTWWDISSDKFMKATIIRCKIIELKPTYENPLLWLNPLIDNLIKSNVGSTFILRHVATVLNRYKNDENICSWLNEYLSNIQALLSGDDYKQNEAHCLFLLDLFIMSVVLVTGCGHFFGDFYAVAESRQKRIDLFPESLLLLCKIPEWEDSSSRIFNFVHLIYLHAEIPVCYQNLAHHTLICLKNHNYFLQNTIWMKFVGLRK